ncbi:MAG: hypothetical protein PHI35_05945 [Victivallaceae bacterium]|nr:hypothetical protein [Victivallaceae bacterium]
MSNQLYSKYLDRAPGTVAQLENSRAANRFGHSFLLQADSALARREFATVIAMIAGCQKPSHGRPCGECAVCRGLEEGKYPEFRTLSPVGRKYEIKVGDRQSPEENTVRAFSDSFSLTSAAGFRKIGVIFDADRMNDEAQNALLKTLEEPPPESVIILATGNPASLLPTTRSRCRRITLLDNACDYEFAGAEELFAALGALVFPTGMIAPDAGERLAAALVASAAGLAAAAENDAAGEWADRVEFASHGDAAFAKRVDEQQTSSAAGAYIRERNRFLSAVHAFCAQAFLLADGADPGDLANPELFKGLTLRRPGLEMTAKLLREAEDLLYTLRFMVSDELALRTFAANAALICMAGNKEANQ